MVQHLITLVVTLIAIASTVAARLTRPDRNYWPMLRVIWAALGFVYSASAVAMLIAPDRPAPAVRLGSSIAMLAAVGYAIWFMRRRNRTARYIHLTIEGHEVFRPIEELEAMASTMASWAAHGDMPAEIAARLVRALAERDRQARWREELAAGGKLPRRGVR